MPKPTYLLLACLVLVGCGPKVEVTPLGPLPDGPNAGEMDVYTSKASVNRPYTEIALITVDDKGWEKSEATLTQLLIDEARKMGADGLILLDQERRSDSGAVVYNVWMEGQRRVVRGSAITYTDPK